MLGHPKYNFNDTVRFRWHDGSEYEGIIAVVDRFGTFEQDKEVSYDIRVPKVALFKHCPESDVIELVKEGKNEPKT